MLNNLMMTELESLRGHGSRWSAFRSFNTRGTVWTIHWSTQL